MQNRILQLEKEIKYLKANLEGTNGSFKIRMEEEIQNLEFDLHYLKGQSTKVTQVLRAPELVGLTI